MITNPTPESAEAMEAKTLKVPPVERGGDESSVVVTPTAYSGAKIAEIEVNGETKEILNGLPDYGTAGQVLEKYGEGPNDFYWADKRGLPYGGSQNSVLMKYGSGSSDYRWASGRVIGLRSSGSPLIFYDKPISSIFSSTQSQAETGSVIAESGVTVMTTGSPVNIPLSSPLTINEGSSDDYSLYLYFEGLNQLSMDIASTYTGSLDVELTLSIDIQIKNNESTSAYLPRYTVTTNGTAYISDGTGTVVFASDEFTLGQVKDILMNVSAVTFDAIDLDITGSVKFTSSDPSVSSESFTISLNNVNDTTAKLSISQYDRALLPTL